MKRILSRKKDNLEEIERRISLARNDIMHYCEYDYIVINKDLKRAVCELKAIIYSNRCKLESKKNDAEKVLLSFDKGI